jgi:hypothetical protein
LFCIASFSFSSVFIVSSSRLVCSFNSFRSSIWARSFSFSSIHLASRLLWISS